MNIDQLSDLPDWDEPKLIFGVEYPQTWIPGPTLEKCKTLYNQWRQIVFLLDGLLDSFIDDESVIEEGDEDEYDGDNNEDNMTKNVALQLMLDAYVVAAKIRNSEIGGYYVLRMGNAAVIRQYATSIFLSLFNLKALGLNEDYINVINKELDKFRLLFIEWVNTFVKDDEFPDDWGWECKLNCVMPFNMCSFGGMPPKEHMLNIKFLKELRNSVPKHNT